MRKREPRDTESQDGAKLQAVLRRQSAEPSDEQRSPWDIDDYELHAHPDLIDRLRELGQGSQRSVTPMFGLPVLVRPGGHAFAIAVGTSTLLLRLDAEPTDVRLSSKPGWFDLPGWVALDAWQSDRPSIEGFRVLRDLMRRAFEQA
ncbi:MAG: hypothetical protein ACR2KK_07330 [Acidimicrobiales bacterium]